MRSHPMMALAAKGTSDWSDRKISNGNSAHAKKSLVCRHALLAYPAENL